MGKSRSRSKEGLKSKRVKSKNDKRGRVAAQPLGGYSAKELKLGKFLAKKHAKLFPYLKTKRDQKAAAQMVLLYIHKAKLADKWMAVHSVLKRLTANPKDAKQFIDCVEDPYCSFSSGRRAFGSVYAKSTKAHERKMADLRDKRIKDEEEAERQTIHLKEVMQRTGMADNTKWAGKGNAASTTRRA